MTRSQCFLFANLVSVAYLWSPVNDHCVFLNDVGLIQKAREGVIRFKRFISTLKLLIITIPTGLHERLHERLHGNLYSAIAGAIHDKDLNEVELALALALFSSAHCLMYFFLSPSKTAILHLQSYNLL